VLSDVSFGEAVYVQIVVSGSTATPTATDEDESYTSTPTAEAMSTTEPTATTVPTTFFLAVIVIIHQADCPLKKSTSKLWTPES